MFNPESFKITVNRVGFGVFGVMDGLVCVIVANS